MATINASRTVGVRFIRSGHWKISVFDGLAQLIQTTTEFCRSPFQPGIWFSLKCHITLRKKVLLSLVAIAAVANHLTACISGQNVWAAVRWVAIGKANAIITGELKF